MFKWYMTENFILKSSRFLRLRLLYTVVYCIGCGYLQIYFFCENMAASDFCGDRRFAVPLVKQEAWSQCTYPFHQTSYCLNPFHHC